MRILAISTDVAADSAAMAKRLNLTFPLLSDPDMRVISAFGVADRERDIAVPSVFLVDKEGRIVWEHIGESIMNRPDPETLLEFIKASSEMK